MMIRTKTAIAAAALILAACGGDAGDSAADTPGTTPPAAQPSAPAVGANVQLPEGVTQDMVAQGQQLFNTGICWTCHGMNGTGGPLGPAMTDQDWLNIDGSYESIVQIINTGVPQPKQYTASAMPPMGGGSFTEEQVRQIAAYVYALSHGS